MIKILPLLFFSLKKNRRIDEKLNKAGWYVVDRDEYLPQNTSAIREALTQGNKESDYLFFIDTLINNR